MKTLVRGLYFVFCTAVAVIGSHINGQWWAVLDFFLAPFVVVKWLIFNQVNITQIKQAFQFFLS